MKYRKLSSDLLFNGEEFIGGLVLIIDETGLIQDLIPTEEAGDNIEHFPGLLTPGFINCHCHLELSHLKGKISPHSGLGEFLSTVMGNRNHSSGDIIEGMIAAEEAMKKAGIVAIGDICNTTDSLSHKLHSDLYYHNFIEVAGFSSHVAGERFSHSQENFNNFNLYGNSTHRQSIVPHAPYSVSIRLYELIADFSRGNILSMHNQEWEAENEFYLNGQGSLLDFYQRLGVDVSAFTPFGKSSLSSVYADLQFASNLILVHNLFSSQEDIELVNQPNVFWCMCPRANLYIDNRLPPEHLLMNDQLKIVIGTDSLASNDSLDILEELKVLKENFPALSVRKLLQAATMRGAEALEINSFAGTIQKGKRPGILHLLAISETEISQGATVTRIV